MNDTIEEDDFQEQPSPAAPPPPLEKRAPKTTLTSKKWLKKFGIASLIFAIICGLYVACGVLPPLIGFGIAAVQIIAMGVYYAAEAHALPTGKKPHRDALGPALRARRHRAGIRFVTLVVLAFLAAAWFHRFVVVGYPLPWKVTDPTSRLFNPEHFRFSDYRTPAEIDRAARILFPLHTQKSAVDAVLMGAGQATIKLYDQGISSKVYCYVYNSSARGFITGMFAWVLGGREASKLWFVFVRYDPMGRVTGVSGTVQYDETGMMEYSDMAPAGTTEPLRRLQ